MKMSREKAAHGIEIFFRGAETVEQDPFRQAGDTAERFSAGRVPDGSFYVPIGEVQGRNLAPIAEDEKGSPVQVEHRAGIIPGGQ